MFNILINSTEFVHRIKHIGLERRDYNLFVLTFFFVFLAMNATICIEVA